MIRAWLLWAAAATSACSEAPNQSEAPVPELSLLALAPIDPEATPGGAPISRIADFEIDAEGQVYVLDGLSGVVRVFDGQGTERRSFGQRGQGPGELEEPAALFWGPEGNLWVVDLGNGRFTVFTPDGELVGTYRDGGPPLAAPPIVGFAESGLLHAVGLDLPGGSLEEVRIVLVEYEVGEAEARPLRSIDLPLVELPRFFEYRRDGEALILTVPFTGQPTFRIDSQGHLWYALTTEPWVHRVSMAGRFDRSFGRDLDPIPLTQAEVRNVLDESPDLEELRNIGPSAVAELADLIPDFRPYIDGFFFDDEQSLWVIRAARSGASGELREIDIYDSAGALTGVARVDLQSEPRPRVKNGLLAGVGRDELGVESIALYRIQR